jgi:hypothetical protein
MKPTTEKRQRKDYRFSPATLRQIEQGRRLTHTPDETAFVEAAIQHYVRSLASQEEMHVLAHPPTQDQAATQVTAPVVQKQPRQPIERKRPLASSPAPSPTLPSSLRQPVYQIFLKHEPGPHPSLPLGFAYMDQHPTIQPEQCPIHRVFAQPCAVAIARQRVEQLKATPSIISLWILDRTGKVLPKDSWQKKDGRWTRND